MSSTKYPHNHEGEFIPKSDMEDLLERTCEECDYPEICALMSRFPEWTPYIANLSRELNRDLAASYTKQILRAIKARVINIVDPRMIGYGVESFTGYVTDLIRRARWDSPIWQVYDDIYEYPSPCCRELMLLLPELSDKQLRIIHRIVWDETILQDLLDRSTMSHNTMTNFFRTIIRGHAAGVLDVNRMGACLSIAHFKRVIRRALRRAAASASAPVSITTAFTPASKPARPACDIVSRHICGTLELDEIAKYAKELGAEYATALLKTIPVEKRRDALSHYLRTGDLLGVTHDAKCDLLYGVFRNTILEIPTHATGVFSNAYVAGYQSRIELYTEVFCTV